MERLMMGSTNESIFTKILRSTLSNVNDQPVVERETINRTELENLNLTTSSVNVELFIHDQPHIDVVLETYEDGPRLTVHEGKNTVDIVVKTERQGIFVLFKRLPTCKLQLTVPRDIARNWQIRTGSGKATVNDLLADTIQFSCNSGKLIVSNLKANYIELKASSGKVEMENIKANDITFSVSSGLALIRTVYGNVTGSANSGSLSLENVNGENLELKASSGSISLEDIIVESAKTKANSGSIVIDGISVKDLDADVSSGSVVVRQLMGNMKGHANSGSINVDLLDNSSLDLSTGSGNLTVGVNADKLNAAFDVRTTSGDILFNLPLTAEHKTRQGFTGVTGTGDIPIRLQSGSGNIRVRNIK